MASQNLAYCSKCDKKHSRPVGNRCKRLFNLSAPAMSADQEDSVNATHRSVQQMDRGNKASRSDQILGDGAHPGPTNNLDTKLDLILRKMQDLEDKNEQLEKKINQQDPIVSASQFVHSSPVAEGKLSRKAGRQRVRRATHQSVADSSDEEDSRFTSKPSDSHLSDISDTELSDAQPSMQFLKQDDATQRKVQRQLLKLQGQARSSHHKPGKRLKSGLHRAGDNSVKLEIPWPHHHCFPGAGGNLPEYKDLSPIQFLIGFMGCIQEEHSNTVRNSMLEYGRHLLQDALETNWLTARHAHMVLLQDMERGKVTWRRPDMVEKIRIRNTARVIPAKSNPTNTRDNKGAAKDKICEDFNKNDCKFSSDHVVGGQIWKHACSYCFKEVGRYCYHKTQDCLRRRTGDQGKDKVK